MNFNELPAGDAQQAALIQRFQQLDKFAWRMDLLSRDDSMMDHLFTTEERDIISPTIETVAAGTTEVEVEEEALVETDAISTDGTGTA